MKPIEGSLASSARWAIKLTVPADRAADFNDAKEITVLVHSPVRLLKRASPYEGLEVEIECPASKSNFAESECRIAALPKEAGK